jgi:cytochrome c-type biogenesis protein CcmH
MLIWMVFAAMTGAAALLLLAPLARRRSAGAAVAQSATDAAFYRAALADIDRDAARGLIGPAEAAAARAEAARRLLRSADAAPVGPYQPDGAARRRRIAAVMALGLVPAVALAVYSVTGSPNLPGRPLAERRAADPQAVDLDDAVARIEAHLSRNPTDGAGFEVIAPVYLRLGRLDDAARAFAASARLNGETADRLANYGEALAAVAGGIVTAGALAQFDRAAAIDPAHPKARYYQALAREQDGDRAGAAAILETLLAGAPADAGWAPAVRERLAMIRGAPAGAEAIAALPEADRNAAIRGMVERLGQRLATNGGVLEDWSRLVRARMVLGEKDEAGRALVEARRALAGDPAAAAPLDALAREFGLSNP